MKKTISLIAILLLSSCVLNASEIKQDGITCSESIFMFRPIGFEKQEPHFKHFKRFDGNKTKDNMEMIGQIDKQIENIKQIKEEKSDLNPINKLTMPLSKICIEGQKFLLSEKGIVQVLNEKGKPAKCDCILQGTYSSYGENGEPDFQKKIYKYKEIR
ncbi:hypothetical protein ELQ15_08255 [Campylobacter sp. US12a]|uniref:hypothetical protein n=1 Tax=Campylobacter sp. US12a TaxID=2498116 RepID=UPI001067EA65|nr:hypothetical protein [Campylobacter sp. US12a]TEY04701.1 hypothetical protein ELQ15_08255 [Campylobacter sp. US12a]